MEVESVQGIHPQTTLTPPSTAFPLTQLSYSLLSGVGAVRLWIVGHSIVHWARLRAVTRDWCSDLQLPNNVKLSWITRRGMRWEEFLPAVSNRIAVEGPPDALVIQLGENDLAYRKGVDLMWNIVNDLEELRASYSNITIIWSSLLERRYWRDAANPVAVNRARRILERSVARRVAAMGGRVIEHPCIQFSKEALYRGDGVHLSDAGNDIWLADICQGIRDWLQV